MLNRLSVCGRSSQPPKVLLTSYVHFFRFLEDFLVLPMTRSGEQRSRRAEEERERRAAESPASR